MYKIKDYEADDLERRSLQHSNSSGLNNASNINSNNSSNSSNINKKKSNYGSLRKEQPQPIVYVKHKLTASETIQGISLKYGVPVSVFIIFRINVYFVLFLFFLLKIESIKRANKLWSNDLALIKDHLLIPMHRDKYNELCSNQNTKIDLDLNDILDVTDINFNNLNNENLNQQQQQSINNNNNNNKNNYKDYLSKFDSFLNESKLKLKSLETIKRFVFFFFFHFC